MLRRFSAFISALLEPDKIYCPECKQLTLSPANYHKKGQCDNCGYTEEVGTLIKRERANAK